MIFDSHPVAFTQGTHFASGGNALLLKQLTTFYSTGTTGLPKGVSFSHRHLVQFVRCGHFSRYAVPGQVLVDAIPKTSVGKPNKRVLREQCSTLLAP